MKTIVFCLYFLSTLSYSQWQPEVRLTNSLAHSEFSALAVSGTVVHVVWQDDRDGNYEIYYKRSTDGGLSWWTDTRLTNYSAASNAPTIAVSNDNVHVVWVDERDGNPEIYYKRSTDGGISWGADTRLTNNSFLSTYASVAVYGSSAEGGVYVIWQDERDLNWEIYYKRSTNGGTSWGADTRLTNNAGSSLYPSIALSGSFAEGGVHVVWQDDRNGNVEIYYKRSLDFGGSWGTDIRMTNNSSISRNPSLTASGSAVHVVWEDNREGNWEIYYKRSNKWRSRQAPDSKSIYVCFG